MRKWFALMVMLGWCQTAAAQTGPGGGLALWVNPATGETWMANTLKEPYAFAGYEIRCETNCLSVEGWLSIDDHFFNEVATSDLVGPAKIQLKLGRRGLLGEVPLVNPGMLAELTMGTPPVLRGEDFVSLGRPILPMTTEAFSELVSSGKLTARAARELSLGVNRVEPIAFVAVPEPSGFALAGLAIGAIAWFRAKTKRISAV